MPNITGVVDGRGNGQFTQFWGEGFATMTGPFLTLNDKNYMVGDSHIDYGTVLHCVGFDFDASRCSFVYKNDVTTVQPPAMTINYYIKVK